jgi:hypothetical protein
VRVDAANGYAQVALADGRDRFVAKARTQGIAALAIRNSHHFAALWTDVEPLAEAGLVAFAFGNGRSRVVPFGGGRRLFGTNPMAFACPRRNGPPMVWDQASSMMAHGEVMLAAMHGKPIPEGAGFDAAGRSTTAADAVLAGGALGPIGGYKGSAIALIVELMGALSPAAISASRTGPVPLQARNRRAPASTCSPSTLRAPGAAPSWTALRRFSSGSQGTVRGYPATGATSTARVRSPTASASSRNSSMRSSAFAHRPAEAFRSGLRPSGIDGTRANRTGAVNDVPTMAGG